MRMSRTTLRSICSRLSCSSSEQITPTATAAATGSARVATKVTTIPILPVWLVLQTTPMSLNRSDITAAKISTAASVGIGTSPTTPENATRMISIQIPAKIDAHRLRAPAATFKRRAADRSADGRAVEEPGGQVRHALTDEVAIGDGGPALGFGADSATPAPCTSAIAAMANAPITTRGQVGQLRQHERRQPARDRADVGHRLDVDRDPSHATSAVGSTTATNDAEQRDPGAAEQRMISASAADPAIADAHRSRPDA